ncbi:MAG: bacillithiol biosynthesis cysteine-adding enzyme BshC [Flavobacteriaceae bacterium]|nr:bacillithiol biosynthesis cysteine-adding enzyme BshC [Flavobacteriaceae bacterium]
MNKIESIPLVETALLSNLVTDYLNKDSEVKNLYVNFPNVKGFENQIEKRKHFNPQLRELLVAVLENQNKKLNLSEKTKLHIHQLKSENTFTVTTGHQLNLFTGPLYVIYKILTTINLTEKLQKDFPKNKFVPVFWMATEDHDFEEINHFWVSNQKIQWNKKSGGAVGKITTDDLQAVFEQFKGIIKNEPNAGYLLNLFENSYLKHKNLADANRFLINELFGAYGLVIIDGNDHQLKNQFKKYIVDELIENSCFKEVEKCNSEIAEKYKIQVNPREINLFYFINGERQRIVYERNKYYILHTSKIFTQAEMLDEVSHFPEKFSPNVLMRPLYQEIILPNLCYIGGAGELAYWLQLKSYFEQQKVDFPILLLRNSALILTTKQQEKLHQLNISLEELLIPLPQLINKKIKEISTVTIDFSKEYENLKAMFSAMEKIAELTDKSFIGAVRAQHQKQINGLSKLEKRLLKAEKRKHHIYINQLTKVHLEIFPNNNLQERVKNTSDFLILNKNFIEDLSNQFDPLSMSFDILRID